MHIYPSVWASIVHLCREIISEAKTEYPNIEIDFIDWETHANIPELPDKDLIGPTALTITEDTPQMFEVSFAIAVSSYSSDKNLFRLRAYLSTIFDRLRVGKKIPIFDSETSQSIGYVIMQPGSMVSPMSRAESRPWQFVQVVGLLDPSVT